ncbi:MAG: dUTP pyrophosphatase, partial [Candidatus Gastranaerophilaceae bacterium]
AIIPTKKDEDGCYDLYACFEKDELLIPSHQVILVPTGIATAFTKKYRLAIRERGSNTKSKLITMAGQVDSGYRGEIFVALYNITDKDIYISKNTNDYTYGTNIFVPYKKAIAQFAMEEVPPMNTYEITYEELLKIPSERGTGALGSSGK